MNIRVAVTGDVNLLAHLCMFDFVECCFPEKHPTIVFQCCGTEHADVRMQIHRGPYESVARG